MAVAVAGGNVPFFQRNDTERHLPQSAAQPEDISPRCEMVQQELSTNLHQASFHRQSERCCESCE